MKRTENKKQGIEGMDELLQAVEMVKRGDDSYFHVIYEKTRGMALAVIRKYNRDQADHEDILQETYLKAYTHMGQLKDNARIQSWINQIAANTAITAAMKKKPTMFSEMEDEEGQPDRGEYGDHSGYEKEADDVFRDGGRRRKCPGY